MYSPVYYLPVFFDKLIYIYFTQYMKCYNPVGCLLTPYTRNKHNGICASF